MLNQKPEASEGREEFSGENQTVSCCEFKFKRNKMILPKKYAHDRRVGKKSMDSKSLFYLQNMHY
jgi:hypothetical protein